MINFDKMIEATAKAICRNQLDALGDRDEEVTAPTSAWYRENPKHEQQIWEFAKPAAIAALRAAFKELPDKFHGNGIEPAVNLVDAYIELKEWANK